MLAHDTVKGIHDLVVHDYGPGRLMITLHAEVDASQDIMEIHDEIDNVERELRETLGCEATIHMDPIVMDDGVTTELRQKVADLVKGIDPCITIHDFRMVAGPTHTNLIFDAVVPFSFRLSDQEVTDEIKAAVGKLPGNYFAVVQIDKAYVK